MRTTARRSRPTPMPKPLRADKNRPNWSGFRAWISYTDDFAKYIAHDRDSLGRDHAFIWDKNESIVLSRQIDFDLTYPSHRQPLQFVGPPVGPKAEPAPHLYALDADDLIDFTSEDILQAWTFRSQCCGSIEVAAELYALYRVLNGDDECYTSATAYIGHSDVVSIFEVKEDQEKVVKTDVFMPATANEPESVNSPDSAGLTLSQISDLSVDELRSAWANRPESFASLEAAAETLAILRSLTTTTPEKPSYRRMMQHELILELEDSLPLEVQMAGPAPGVELALMKVDRRSIRTQLYVNRPAQGNFRSALLGRYGGECCITGCRVDTLLEAAHIIPYMGDHSDDVTNGLLLRVDLHRLFDAHLVTISPTTFTVEVAVEVDDAEYQAFHGKRLFGFSPKPRLLFLEAHYQMYQSAKGRKS